MASVAEDVECTEKWIQRVKYSKLIKSGQDLATLPKPQFFQYRCGNYKKVKPQFMCELDQMLITPIVIMEQKVYGQFDWLGMSRLGKAGNLEK